MSLRLLLVVISFSFANVARADCPKRKYIALQPLGGEIPLPILRRMRAGARVVLGLPLRVLPTVPPPFAARMHRGYEEWPGYNADELVDWLKGQDRGCAWKIVGVLGAPLYSQGVGRGEWHYVGGVAAGAGGFDRLAALVSFHRAQDPLSEQHVIWVAQVLLHEVGHLLYLDHCMSPTCLMRVHGYDRLWHSDFCPACRQELATNKELIASGFRLPRRTDLPWPPPPLIHDEPLGDPAVLDRLAEEVRSCGRRCVLRILEQPLAPSPAPRGEQ